MNTSSSRSSALLIAGAFIGILGSLLIPHLLNNNGYKTIYFCVIFSVFSVITVLLFLYGSGKLSNAWHWCSVTIIREYFPKVGILNDIGLLFSTNTTAELEGDLCKGIIPKKLTKKFKKKDILLSENITVKKEKEDEWKITNEEKTYIVKKEDKMLNIYDMTNEENYTDILPEEWKKRIERHAKSEGVKVQVKLIRIDKNFDSYAAIINPFGAVYPESDLKSFDTLNKIFNYVEDGGLFVNTEDIFGYFAYNALLEPGRKIETPPPVYGMQYASDGKITALIPARPFERTPAMEKLGLRVLNTENNEQLCRWDLKFENMFGDEVGPMCGVKVPRVVVVEKNVKPIVKSQKSETNVSNEKVDVTPLCFINYGNVGKFLMSLLRISDQDENIQEKLQKVLAELVINYIKSIAKKDCRLMNRRTIVFAFICIVVVIVIIYSRG